MLIGEVAPVDIALPTVEKAYFVSAPVRNPKEFGCEAKTSILNEWEPVIRRHGPLQFDLSANRQNTVARSGTSEETALGKN
jgi:hypothetical protein